MSTPSTLARKRIADTLVDMSATVRRPMAINDRNMAPVASSPHEGPLDASRLELILGRPAPQSVRVQLFEREQINNTVQPRYIDGFEGLDLGRVYVPVRGAGAEILGHLWLIDADRTMSMTALQELSDTVSGAVGADLQQLYEDPSTPGTATSLDILAADMRPHRVAVLELPLSGGFDPHGQTYQGTAELIESSTVAEAFQLDIAATSQVDGYTHQTELVLAGHASALERGRVATMVGQLLDHLARQQHLDHQLPAEPIGRAVVSPVRGADDPIAPALSALHDCATLRKGMAADRVGFAEDSDVFGLLTELRQALGAEGYRTPASVAPLLTTTRRQDIARTTKAYLDSDRNAQETADKLFMHRGTLYYRINQAQALTGLSLTGVDRVRLHLGLILAELTGAI